MHHTTSSPISLQDRQHAAKPGSRVSPTAAPPESRHRKSRSIDRIWPPALDLKLSQIAQHNKKKQHYPYHNDKPTMDVDMDVEKDKAMDDVIGHAGRGGGRYQSNNNHNNSNRRAHYHLPGVYPLTPERTKEFFDMDMETVTEMMPTDTSLMTTAKRSKRPWPWTSASASAASVAHPSREPHHGEDGDGVLTVQYLRHSKSWTCLSDISRLAMARAGFSEETEGGEDQDMSRRRREEDEKKDGVDNNALALGDKTPRVPPPQQAHQQQQRERAKLDESDRKMLAAQSILQWQNEANQSTGSTDSSNYTQSTSTAVFPHKTVTTTIVAIDDISTGRPTYTATTATFSAADDISTNRSTATASRPSPASAATPLPTRPLTTTDDISCYRPPRRAPAPISVTTSIASPVPTSDDISSRPPRGDTTPRTDSRPTPRPAAPTTDDISCHRVTVVRSIPKTDDISSRATVTTTTTTVRPIPRTDDISSRPLRPIPTADDISSRPTRPTPRIDDISSRPTRSVPKTDDTSSRPARSVPSIDDITSRPTRSTPPTSFATTTTTVTVETTDDISCLRPTARRAQMRPDFLTFTPIDESLDTTMTNTTTTTTISYESVTTEPPRSNSPHLSIPSPASSGGGRYSPYYYSQLSPYSRAGGAASPIPERRWSAETTVQMCILQGFLDRHSNGHIMYPKPKPSKCCSLSGCSNSDSEEGEYEDSSSNGSGSGSGSSSSSTSFSDSESDDDRDEDDKDVGEIDEEDEEIQNRMLLLSQSPNLSDLDFRRDFFMTERQSTASNRNADSPVFFQGFPLLNMTRIE